jgi:hypothetical protein
MDMVSKEDLKEFMVKEIDIIQDIIKRMAYNSFLAKGWSVTLIVGSLLLKGPDKYQVCLAFIPLFTFWYLDAYFLRQERLFRKLYDWVRTHRLYTDEGLFDMSTNGRSDEKFEEEVDSIWRTMFCNTKDGRTNTLRRFYGSIVILILIYSIILFLL